MKNKSTLSLAAAVAAAFTLAPAAQAATVMSFTSSGQLNLSGRTVLAAVNLYDADRGNTPYDGTENPFYTDGENTQMTGTLQGVTFQNYDYEDGTTLVAALNLSAGGTLTTVYNNALGRANSVGQIFLANGDDDEQAGRLATDIVYNNVDGDYGTLTFAGLAPLTLVEIQLVGGGVHNATASITANTGTDSGAITASGNSPYGAELLTLSGTTDGSGGLVINMTSSTKNVGISGVIVTVPEPSTMLLLGLGGLGLLRRRRRA